MGTVAAQQQNRLIYSFRIPVASKIIEYHSVVTVRGGRSVNNLFSITPFCVMVVLKKSRLPARRLIQTAG